MHDDSFDSNLPDDLRSIADALSREREVADGHLLERVLRRVTATPRERRRRRFVSVRTVVTMGIAAMCLIGVRLSGTSVSGAAATLVATITSGTSNSTSGSAADMVYGNCGAGTATGSSGWAPTFRFHFGNVPGADNGWSASVQPSCPSGALTISLNDPLSLAPGTNLGGGYDFHTSGSPPPYTMTATSPTIVFSKITCANGTKPTQSTLTMSIPSGSYASSANNWVPTDDKSAAAGFQGSLVIPALCGKSNVVIGTASFTASIKIS